MKKDIYCIVVLEARSLKLRCPQGPGEGGSSCPAGPRVPGFAAPHSRLCLVCLRFQSPLSLSERQPLALGPPSSGLTSAPETLFSNKVRFRCGGEVSSQDTRCLGRSPKCPALSANTSHTQGFPLLCPGWSPACSPRAGKPPHTQSLAPCPRPGYFCPGEAPLLTPSNAAFSSPRLQLVLPVCPSPWLPHAQ